MMVTNIAINSIKKAVAKKLVTAFLNIILSIYSITNFWML